MAKIRVVLAGGVSGGHTFPLIAVAQALRKECPEGAEFLFLGSGGKFQDDSLAQEGIAVRYIASGKLRRYFSWRNIIDPFKVPVGFVQSLWQLFRFLPDAVFAKGASGSVPVVLAAWLYRIPIILHDSDAIAGRATRFLARFATRIAVAYPSAHAFFPQEKTALVGNPLREEILLGNRERALQKFSFNAEKPTIFFFGGSLGARALNQALLRILPHLLASHYQVIHQTGEEGLETVLKESAQKGVEQGKGYLAASFFNVEDIADILTLSDVVVSRAGANTISELAAVKKACILVPLPTAANDEQRANAYEIAKIGGAVVLEEANLGEHLLSGKIKELVESREIRTSMGEAISQFYHPEAARNIALGLKELANR